MNSAYRKKFEKYLFPIIGVLIVFIGMLPYFILQGRCVVSIRDELDGGAYVGYLLGEGSPFFGSSYYPQYLGGLNAVSLTPPSLFTAVLFRLFSPLHALILNRLYLMLVAFIGMYLWLTLLLKNRWIALICGELFAFLPYYTVYGLSCVGIPLAMWAYLSLLDYKGNNKALIPGYLSIALFGFSSSLGIIGYAVLMVYGFMLIAAFVKIRSAHTGFKMLLPAFAGMLELLIIYIVDNVDLIMQVLLPEKSFISHRVASAGGNASFLEYFKDLLLNGNMEAPSLHKYILAESVVVLAALVIYYLVKRKSIAADGKKYLRYMFFCLIAAVSIAVLSAFKNSVFFGEAVKNSVPGMLRSFPFDRFYWFYPFIWYTALGVMGSLLAEIIRKYHLGSILWGIMLIPCAFTVVKNSMFKENAMEFVRDNSNALTWNAYFCENEFADVADYINSTTGLTQDQYRIGCLGIEPAVAVQAGFYTIDGYVSNYELSYKESFRRIIADELEKNAYNKQYFDDWGNRCYLYSSEYYGYPLLTKYEHPYYDNLEFDVEALKDIGCNYILAAGEINGADQKGYKLCRVFDSVDYTYVIYLYRVV